MMGRFLSGHDMASAKHEEEVYNSMKKRGEVKDSDKIVSERHVVCGCGVSGCIFISAQRKD